MESKPTRVLLAMSESTIRGYPYASIRSRGAFEWTIRKIVRSNTSGFRLHFLHVQVLDEDGFDDMDSIYASPEDFKSLKQQDRIRGLHLLEYFVNRCHEIGDPQPKKNKKHRSSSLGSSSQNSESSDTQDVDLELRILL
ncbi:hypothetical protein Q3G72_020604 [Acer saccharum]|nr:hypothetical protein Q3G72_020604 [Acer saccharum]